MAGVSTSDDFVSEINVTPFVDVMLVLLIIFMVTAPMMTEGLDVELPKVEASETLPTENDHVMLTIKDNGAVFLDEYETTLPDLPSVLETNVRLPQRHGTIYLNLNVRINFIAKDPSLKQVNPRHIWILKNAGAQLFFGKYAPVIPAVFRPKSGNAHPGVPGAFLPGIGAPVPEPASRGYPLQVRRRAGNGGELVGLHAVLRHDDRAHQRMGVGMNGVKNHLLGGALLHLGVGPAHDTGDANDARALALG